MRLSSGAVSRIFNGNPNEEATLQVLNVKKIQSNAPAGGAGGNQPERYRLVVSDGVHFMQAMMATQMNDLVSDRGGKLEQHSLIHVKECIVNTVHNRKLVILLNLEVVHATGLEKIGDPQNIDASVGAGASSEGARPQASAPAAAHAPAHTPASAPGGAAKQQSAPYSSNQYNRPAAAPAPSAYGGAPRGGAIVKSEMDGKVCMIGALNPYNNRWIIQVRVISKSPIRTWQNEKGAGKLFSMEVCDESGELRCTCFKEGVDKFYDFIQVDKVYLISKGQVKPANKQFNPNGQYELTLDQNSFIELCDDTSKVPSMKYTFVKIGDLENAAPNTLVDVIGVLKEVGNVVKIVVKKTNTEVEKRDVQIADESGKIVQLTLWDSRVSLVSEDDAAHGSIFAAKNVRVSDFGGRSLSMAASSHAELNIDHHRAAELRLWWQTEGGTAALSSMSGAGGSGRNDPLRTIAAIKEEDLGGKEKADYIKVRARIFHIPHEKNLYYQACPEKNCNKKVTESSDTNFYCEKCARSFPKCDHRYIMGMMLTDTTGTTWASAFNEIGEKMLGRTANELAEMKKIGDETGVLEVIHKALFKNYTLKLRCKMETYQETNKVKVSIIDASEVNYAQECRALLDYIKAN